ncbi:IBR domain protein, partial [Dictyocaulus viviparus]
NRFHTWWLTNLIQLFKRALAVAFGGSRFPDSRIMDDDNTYESADDIDEYYNACDYDMNLDGEEVRKIKSEDAEFECLNVFQVERVLNESVASLVDKAKISPTLARMLLHANEWDVNKVSFLLSTDETETLKASGILPPGATISSRGSSDLSYCAVCAEGSILDMRSLACGHTFCAVCWRHYIEAKICEGIASWLECMEPSCNLLCPSDFVLRILDKPHFRARYERFVFRDYVSSHPQLKFCVGKDCQLWRDENLRNIVCGVDYHAPTSCDTIKQWLLKCADDSETANYISKAGLDSLRTMVVYDFLISKVVPTLRIVPNVILVSRKMAVVTICNVPSASIIFVGCVSAIGKLMGVNTTNAADTRFVLEVLLSDDCKENPSVAAEANHVKARRALEKYLHYYERFENHSKSLRLEQQFRDKIQKKIESKVNDHDGTWIDWQYLHNAALLLTKCRYTLQYTYPFAYFMENGARKQLNLGIRNRKHLISLATMTASVSAESKAFLRSIKSRASILTRTGGRLFRCSGLFLSGPAAIRFLTDEIGCRILEGTTFGTT